jgi:hypothetical protein
MDNIRSSDEDAPAPQDTSEKKDGVTSSFSAATTGGGAYSGEDIDTDLEGTGDDKDKIAGGRDDDPAGD